MSEKQRVIERLRASGEEALERLRGVPEESLASGRYEGGWNGRQILAHIAAIEWTYARLVDLAQEPSEAPSSRPPQVAGEGSATAPASAPPRGGMDDYNARQVEKRANASAAELIDEFAANRARTIEALARADESFFERPIRSAGGISGTLGQVMETLAIDHIMSHVGDITGERWSGARG